MPVGADRAGIDRDDAQVHARLRPLTVLAVDIGQLANVIDVGSELGAVGERMRDTGGGWIVDAMDARAVLDTFEQIRAGSAAWDEKVAAVRAWQTDVAAVRTRDPKPISAAHPSNSSTSTVHIGTGRSTNRSNLLGDLVSAASGSQAQTSCIKQRHRGAQR